MPLNLLLIDDDTAVTELLTILLGNHGFEVRTANNGTEGLRLARAMEPDLVVLDLMMPEMDGWSVCREIRSFSNAPILVLSALNSPNMIADILDSGADDFLTKPAISTVLLAHINRLVSRNAGRITKRLTDGPDKQTGRTRPLAPREIQETNN